MLVLLRMRAKESQKKNWQKYNLHTPRLTPVTPGVQSLVSKKESLAVSLWHMMEKMPILIFRQRYLIVSQS